MSFELITPQSYPLQVLDKDWNKRKCYFYKGNQEFANKIHNMEVYDDDVWIVTLAKCGTTWMQELVWLILNDYDFDAANSEHLEVRTPFLEFDFLLNGDTINAFKPVENLKRPRLIKSHLPLPLLPKQLWEKKPKLIYVFRDPKDAFVSKYHHARSLGFEMDKTLEEVLTFNMETAAIADSLFEHVTEFYALRNEPWIYYTSFERMKLNLREIINHVCRFLNKSINEEQMQQMLHHLSFEQMKANPKLNHDWEFEQIRNKEERSYEKSNFIRKGKVGAYKEELSAEFMKKLNNWVEDKMAAYNKTLNELLLLE